MSLLQPAPLVATINGQVFHCLVCQGGFFIRRRVRLEYRDLAWADSSAQGLVCQNCGYVHQFLGDAVDLWDSESGDRVI
ncbi:hypothetical protein [Hamadaea tsunoensis]|uniref:hypothetical protein n=1 Tax=Hamadaea tsunoensis TaxID=53368 RepID=UPI0012F9AA1E|nr:hypothetical protein [Hamadaea tsunoensis]